MPIPRRRAPDDSPLRNTAELEELVAAAWAALWMRIRLLPRRVWYRAIRQGTVEALTGPSYDKALVRSARQVAAAETASLARGMRTALLEIPETRLGSVVGELAQKLGAARTVGMIQGVERSGLEAIDTLIKDAARRYAEQPSLKTLRGLVDDIRPHVGLTKGQIRWLKRQHAGLKAKGISDTAARRVIASRARRQVELRAKAMADRGVVEAINAGRHEARLEARSRGELPADVMKQWRDQGDSAVRESHRAQTQYGPVPLDEPYPIQGVMYPPSPDRGCRCWDELVAAQDLPAGGERSAEEIRRMRQVQARQMDERRRRIAERAKMLEGAPIRPGSPAEVARRRRRASASARQATGPLTREQLEQQARQIQRSWVHGSRSKTAVHFQEAARREFGIDVAVYNKRGHQISESLVDRYRQVVRYMYRQTQESLARQGIGSVQLYRGVKTTAVPMRGVVESWSSQRRVAEKFMRAGPLGEAGRGAGAVMQLDVDARRIIMMHNGPLWSTGRYGEQFEWLVLGGSELPSL